MDKTLFDYLDYKHFLRDKITSSPKRGRGERSRLAEALNCHTAFITHVLKGEAEFSMEQADRINRFLGHNEEESRFFLLLVQFKRAGTPTLRDFFRREIQLILDKRLTLHERLEFKKALSEQDQALYYSSWLYSAVHILVSIPDYQTKEAISRCLHLPLAKVSEILEFLAGAGMVASEQGRFKVGATSIHLGDHSPMIAKHHMNWRMRAMESLDRRKPAHLHYSSVVSMSESDAPKVKSILIEAIEKARAIIRESKEEKAYCYSLDFFEIAD